MFWSGKIDRFSGEYAFLSNFYPSSVTDYIYTYPTVEHAYVAFKTIDVGLKKKISEIPLPGQAKKFGRKLQLRADWENIKVPVMILLLEQKFSIPELRQKLIETDGMELIEGNTWGDRFWGVCNGKGENMLGNILMNIREKIIVDSNTN